MEEAARCLAITIVAELEMRDGDLSEIEPPPQELVDLYHAGAEVQNSLVRKVREFGRSRWGDLPVFDAPKWRVARA